MFNLRKLIFMVVAAAALALYGCAAAPPPDIPAKDWKMSVVTNEDSSWTRGANLFADLVRSRSGGRMQITVYPNARLAGGDQVRELEMLREGGIDFTYHSNLLYSNLNPSFAAFSLPWLFAGYTEADVALAGQAGSRLLKETEDYGIEGLAYGENGFRQLTNNKLSVSTPADLRGLKVRIPSVKLYDSIYRALGAVPVEMNFGEVIGAIRQGQVDGQENPIDIIVSSRLYEVQDHLTTWNYSYDALILGMNRLEWDNLPASTQAIIRQAAAEASKEQVRLSREAARTRLGLLLSRGMAITELTPGQVKAFRTAVEPVYSEWTGKIGPGILELMMN